MRVRIDQVFQWGTESVKEQVRNYSEGIGF